MLRLILMRHAKSSWDARNVADFDRPLNSRGTRSARAMGDWLRAKSYVPGQVLCSTARRTRETLEGLALPGDVPVEFLDELYHGEPITIRKVLRRVSADSVLVIGHNPGIGIAARKFLDRPPAHDRFDDYPTGATLVADFDAPDWSNLQWGDGRAMDFAVPREQLGEASDRT
ncbi:histidine phosphatase family protein [Sulfitobacter sp. LCG007]